MDRLQQCVESIDRFVSTILSEAVRATLPPEALLLL
jgi:hypothetical protein